MTDYTNSPLTKFQRSLLPRLSDTEWLSASDLREGTEDPRGVGASLAALSERGLVEIDAKRGRRMYRRRDTPVRSKQQPVRWYFVCPTHGRLSVTEMSADKAGHDVRSGDSGPHRVCREPMHLLSEDLPQGYFAHLKPDYRPPDAAVSPQTQPSLDDLAVGDEVALGSRTVVVRSAPVVFSDGTRHVVVRDDRNPGVSGDRYLHPSTHRLRAVSAGRYDLLAV